MKRVATAACAALLIAACQACGDSAEGVGADGGRTGSNGDAVAGQAGDSPSRAGGVAADTTWPERGPVDYRRVRTVELTGDGDPEAVMVTARGPAYDSLDIALAITSPAGDTLWHEAWPSLLYFKYDPIEGKPDSTVRATVRDHVEQLLANDRFTMRGGLPPALSRGGDPVAIMREAIHYHLAELDWRRDAGVSPGAATPLEAYSEISTDNVPASRVDTVLEDVRGAPSFMYFAGGEATYALAWSDLEQSFVRIYSCC